MRQRMLPLIISIGLISSVLMGTGLAAEEEGAGGNNLSTPVIFAEGYGLGGVAIDTEDYTTTGFPGLTKPECLGEENWSGSDGAPYAISYDESGTDPILYTLNIDGKQYLTPLKGTSTASEGDYFLQPYTLDGDDFGTSTCWEADWVDGSGFAGVEINALDVGDSLVRVLRKEGSNPIRVEFSPFQAAEVAGTFQDGILLDGYPMTQLWPPGFSDGKPPSVGSGERQEVWATAAPASGPGPAEVSGPEPVPTDVASVYSHNARLTIHRLTWDGLPDSFADGNLDGYPSGVIPDTFDSDYDRWIENVEYDGTVGGGEGEAGFSAEVNQGGRALYGYNWGLQSGVDTGWYRVTLSIDGDVGGVPANALITGVNPDDVLADESEGGSDGGSKGFFPPNLVEDTAGNYVYVDVYIAPSGDTGKGRMNGRVTTEDGNPLGGKLVTMYDGSGSPAMTATTAVDGTFEVAVLPGTYYVEVDDPTGKYRGEFYDDRATFDDADAVVITDGGTTFVPVELAEEGTEPPVEPPVQPPVDHNGPVWFLRNSLLGGSADTAFGFGRTGDLPLVGDWDGDGDDTPGVRRSATWYLNNQLSGGTADLAFTYGRASDTPVVGDWDGNGTVTPAVVRDASWYLRQANAGGSADTVFRYGIIGDVPVVGDWDGDGDTTAGVRRGATWYLRNGSGGGVADVIVTFGRAGDVPIVGDWDGDGRDEIGVKRGATWYLVDDIRGGAADHVITYGRSSDIAVPGDWDGDGDTTLGVVRSN